MRDVLRIILLPFVYIFNLAAVGAMLLLGSILAGAVFYAVIWVIIHGIGLIASAHWVESHMLALRTSMHSKFTQIGVTLAIVAVVWSWVRTATTWRAMGGSGTYPIGTRFLSIVLRVVSPEGYGLVMQDKTEHPVADMAHDVIEDVIESGQK
jgi:hypothetical protein